MSEMRERQERVEEAGRHDKYVAGLIAVLAVLLAVSDMLGKGVQTAALRNTVKETDTWGWFQARNVRVTTLRTAKEVKELEVDLLTDPGAKAKVNEKIKAWGDEIERLRSGKDGMDELQKKAEDLQKRSEYELTQYHNYELASAMFQVGIVLASVAIIASMAWLAWVGGGLCGVIGLAFMLIGRYAPHAVHLL